MIEEARPEDRWIWERPIVQDHGIARNTDGIARIPFGEPVVVLANRISGAAQGLYEQIVPDAEPGDLLASREGVIDRPNHPLEVAIVLEEGIRPRNRGRTARLCCRGSGYPCAPPSSTSAQTRRARNPRASSMSLGFTQPRSQHITE